MPTPMPARHQTLLATLAVCATALMPIMAAAQPAPYPDKPVRLVLPYGAGGPTDVHLRVVAQQASARLGQPIIIENKPGANGTFGAAEIARASADGYTLGVLPASVYREPHLNTVPFDPLTLTYIIGLSDYTFGLAVRQDAPWQTWQAFVEDARKRPGQISVGAAGPVQTPSLVLSELSQAAGIALNRIPYKGDAEQVSDLLGGHIEASILSGVSSAHIRSGTLRYLVMLTPERVKQFPDVPTLRELGLDAAIESPYGIAGPQGLAPERVQILHDAFHAALTSDEGLKVLDQLNQPLNHRDSAAFTRYAKDAFAREKERMAAFNAQGGMGK